MIYKNFIKRLIDLILGFLAFILLSPFFILIAILLAIVNVGTPFFFQRRPGKDGVIFSVIKFKTMNDKRDEKGKLLPDDQRLTKLGLFVRKTSLDEIPQLLNVIIGHMSLIGPRPLLVEYLPLYSATQLRRHSMRPGITGWAQVNGRNLVDWPIRFEMDVWYVDNVSFLLDMKILYMTIAKVFKSEGVSSENFVTMEKFKGNINEYE